jgi:hypothetical protein
MKKLALAVLLILVLALPLAAAPVTGETAKRVAMNWGIEHMFGANVNVSRIDVVKSNDVQNLIYAVSLRPDGFVLVTGDDIVNPILGYCAEGSYSPENHPEAFDFMIDQYRDGMVQALTGQIMATPEIAAQWSRLTTVNFQPIPQQRDVSPLLHTTWGQESFYNDLCPGNCPVGCVALAMGQIMKYWAFPTVGQGSHSYTHPVYGAQTANFGTTSYAWSSMPNAVTSANTSVATALYQLGVSVDMDYAPDGSGAYSIDVPDALISYFKFQSSAQYRNKSAYSNTNWEILLRGELDNARPVYYSGSGPAGGHAWVVDGYQSTNYFHVNWGWYGYYNGYYYLSNLNPGGDTFNNDQAAVTGIRPTTTVSSLAADFESTTFPPSGWATGGFTRTTASSYIIAGTASASANGTGTISNKFLRTPKLTIASASALSFKAKRGTSSYSEVITVQYSSDGTTWTDVAGAAYTLTNTGTTYTLNIGTLITGDYYLRFNCSSSNTTSSNKRFVIDDVAGPPLWQDPNPVAALNITSWAAGTMNAGDMAASGNTFQLSNIGQGTLTITSITDLSASEFKCTLDPLVTLAYGQNALFGFTYEPVNYGTDNQTVTIVTSGGTVNITLSGTAEYPKFFDGFESYTDFTLDLTPWTQYDGDLLDTYGVTGYSWDNAGYIGSWMAFNPSTTTPAMTETVTAHTGAKFASCWAGVPAGTVTANNDWLITPVMSLGSSPSLKFWAKAMSASYSERFWVYYSTTNNTNSSFTAIGASYTTVSSTTWTEYTVALPAACANCNTVYLAIKCVSSDAWALCVDDFKVLDASPPPAPQFGNLNGYVYRHGTTEPIQGAVVTVGSKSATTNASGFYQINNLLVGAYNLSVTTPGMFYFDGSASGVAITNGVTTSQNLTMTWAEMDVSTTSITQNLYTDQTSQAVINLSNAGGTANLEWQLSLAETTAALSRQTRRPVIARDAPSLDSPTTHSITRLPALENERADGWYGYAGSSLANYYTSQVIERGTKFLLTDLGLFSNGADVTQLRTYCYNLSSDDWGTNNTFVFKVYAADGTTLLYTSPSVTAVAQTTTLNPTVFQLPTPLHVTGDFWVSVTPIDGTNGKPFSLCTDAVTGHSYSKDAVGGAWTAMNTDMITHVYLVGNEWVTPNLYSGTVPAGSDQNITLSFNGAGLSNVTRNARLTLYNNSDYVAPSGRGDNCVIPVSLTVTTPTLPVPQLNTSAWSGGGTVGTPVNSGDVLSLTNIGPGTLTVSSISGLAGTPFTTNLTTAVALTNGQSAAFGVTFNPTAVGVYNASLQIVTNNGALSVALSAYATGADYVTEGFEGATFPPSGWSMTDADGDTQNWFTYTATGSAHNGIQSAASASYTSSAGPLTPQNDLILPTLHVLTGDLLVYWIAAQDPAWPSEHYAVKLSTTGTDPADFSTTLYSETLSDDVWRQHVIDLSAYAGQTVYVAFEHYGCTNQFYLKLDDVVFPQATATLSGTVTRAISGAALSGMTVAAGSYTATTDANGAYSIAHIIPGTYDIVCSGNRYIPQTISGVTLNGNDTVTRNLTMQWAQITVSPASFNTSMNPDETITRQITINSQGTADLEYELASGIWGGSFVPYPAVNITFESGFPYAWDFIGGDDSAIYNSVGYDASKCLAFCSKGYPQPQWLISPQLTPTASDSLAFYYNDYNNTGAPFEIRVSTTDANTSSFTGLLLSVTCVDDAWHRLAVNLGTYAGQQIYVAVKYLDVVDDYDYLLIDNITGPTYRAPASGWLTDTPDTGTLATGTNVVVSHQLNSAGLPDGTYTGQTWVFSNDQLTDHEVITTSMTVMSVLVSPSNVIITRGADTSHLTWGTVPNANLYHIYASNAPYTGFTQLGTSATTTYNDVYTGTNYRFYRVTADRVTRDQSVTRAPERTGQTGQATQVRLKTLNHLSAPTGNGRTAK